MNRPERTPSARRAVAAGLLLAVIWIGAAAISGRISVTARRPLLDGLAPVVPYRWVDPPPELTAGNEEPSSLDTKVDLGPEGSRAFALSTSDVQVTLIMTNGLVPPAKDASAVRVRIQPLDPSKFPAAPEGLELGGNVYRIAGTYEPSNDPAGRFTERAKVVLTYPALATQHSNGHEMLYSADGETWRRMDTVEVIGLQQTESMVPGFGYVAVGGRPFPQGGAASGDASTTVPIILVVVAGSVALVAIGLGARYVGRRSV